MTSSDRRIAVGLFVLAFVTYAWFFGGGGWNQNAHFDLTRAIVERQTFHIDGYRVNTGDISWSPDAHAYSNKPPGLPFLAVTPYAAIYGIERALGLSVDDWLVMTVNVYFLTLILCAAPGALIAVVLFRHTRSIFTAWIVAFGTIVFPYSTMLFSVVPAALFLLLAFVWLDDRPLLAGVCAGIAGMCYYPCILATAVLAIGILLRSRRNGLRFIAGGLPFGILLGYYHTIAFGAPWRTSLEVAQNFTERDLFLGLFRRGPTADALWGLTLSEYRGLFFVSPVLLMAVVGAAIMIRRRVMLRELAMIAAIVTIFLLLIASFNGWEGGASFGARHILPIVPLLAIPIAFLRGRLLLAIAVVLALASFAMHFMATAVDPMPAGGIRFPMRAYYLPVFRTGNIPPGRGARRVPPS